MNMLQESRANSWKITTTIILLVLITHQIGMICSVFLRVKSNFDHEISENKIKEAGTEKAKEDRLKKCIL